MDEAMTLDQAARALGISRQRVSYLMKLGRLDAVPEKGARVMLTRESVERRIELMDAPNRWLTMEDVARIHGASPRSVRRWHAKGMLPGTLTPTGRLLFDPAVVATFVRPQRGRTAPKE